MSNIPIIIVVPRRDPTQYPPPKPPPKMRPGEVAFICALGLPVFFLYLGLSAYVMWYFVLAYVVAAIVYSRRSASPSTDEQTAAEPEPEPVDLASFTILALPVDAALPALCSCCGRETDYVVSLLAKQQGWPAPTAAAAAANPQIEMLLHLPVCEACNWMEPKLEVADFSARTMSVSVCPVFAAAVEAMPEPTLAEGEAGEATPKPKLTVEEVKRRALAKRHKTV